MGCDGKGFACAHFGGCVLIFRGHAFYLFCLLSEMKAERVRCSWAGLYDRSFFAIAFEDNECTKVRSAVFDKPNPYDLITDFKRNRSDDFIALCCLDPSFRPTFCLPQHKPFRKTISLSQASYCMFSERITPIYAEYRRFI